MGLVPTDNIQQIPFAWSLYLRGMFSQVFYARSSINLHFLVEDDNADQDRAHYKRTFSTNVTIDFVGVWSVTPLVHRLYTVKLMRFNYQGNRLDRWDH